MTMGHSEGLERMLERALDQRDEREAENKRLLDQLKRTQGYEASILGDMERLKTVLTARLARIEELEDKLLGCNRDRKEYRKQIDQLAKEKQDLAAQCARLRRKSREGK